MEPAAPSRSPRQADPGAASEPAGRPSRRFSPVNFKDVTITGAFWRERLDTALTRTIPSQHEQLERNGILESLDLPPPPPPLRIPIRAHGLTTQVFWDSDVGKWIETASYGVSFRRDRTMEQQIEAITDRLAAAQLPDGYLNCWYIGREIDNRWTNLRDKHELYCAGHLLEGAIAYFDATGRRRLLDSMIRYVDHIAATFGTGAGQKPGYCGHPEIELALVKLYRVTGERRHLDLAAYFVTSVGRNRTTSTSKHGPGATTRESITSRPTNTTSRTGPSASRTRWSGTRCAGCTSTPPWPISPPRPAMGR
jgi:DUF1680 family protein